jgi:hypothetical protein
MGARTRLTVAALLLGASPGAANDAEVLAIRAVRLTTEAAVLQSCTRLGSARDDSVKDLRRKIVRSGGNAAFIAFGIDELSMIYAEVYRCPTTAGPPPGVPPPPAGSPPPPPPSR